MQVVYGRKSDCKMYFFVQLIHKVKSNYSEIAKKNL